MKQSTTLTRALQNLITKIFFCSQVIIISSALPSLFYIGITHNNESKPKKHLLITNKGKKTLVSAEKAGKIITYSTALQN
ncbi:MAG TPA: hypothetical protein VMY77_06850 [Chitinophagaceae bacterium]|nr:hypothetical protein [Chitinophagaceae bacterium]